MRILGFLLVLVVISLGVSSPSYALDRSGPWGVFSSQNHSSEFAPYLGEEQMRQRFDWDGDTWTPQEWIKQDGDEKRMMRELYAVDIITDQFTDDDIPYLEVGEKFMQLSGVDRLRVLKFVDYVFAITESEENGMFYIVYSEDDEELVGLYNKYGFQRY